MTIVVPTGAGLVLAVDDSPDTIRLLNNVLEQAGMTVIIALDGDAALAVAQQITPDLVLMDAVMPGMDGFETCRRLKRIAGFQDVPVIFMTGLSSPADAVRGFAAGGADYVTKPMDIDSVVARIEVHLANSRKLRDARKAMDAADQFLIAADRDGVIQWFTPQALRLLEERMNGGGRKSGPLTLPDPITLWLSQAQLRFGGTRQAETVFTIGGLQTRLAFVGETERGEFLFRIANAAPDMAIARLREQYALTPREAEVLTWLSQGKSNRDIASILGLSPRTIEKYLETIFSKLSVENRTSAVALVHTSRT